MIERPTLNWSLKCVWSGHRRRCALTSNCASLQNARAELGQRRRAHEPVRPHAPSPSRVAADVEETDAPATVYARPPRPCTSAVDRDARVATGHSAGDSGPFASIMSSRVRLIELHGQLLHARSFSELHGGLVVRSPPLTFNGLIPGIDDRPPGEVHVRFRRNLSTANRPAPLAAATPSSMVGGLASGHGRRYRSDAARSHCRPAPSHTTGPARSVAHAAQRDRQYP